jgi:hypothetical protein
MICKSWLEKTILDNRAMFKDIWKTLKNKLAATWNPESHCISEGYRK